ncbi:hypothetical protein [Methylomonas sp. AM2-LC]|uniref:alpha-glutamyl/putrescinyl thymine pyrophosphorylase clade 3 protein n=1 Tax=Methylomonas sp. AM2-LC TaxID=3153301 RepID=UPI0032657730
MQQLSDLLTRYEAEQFPLPGIHNHQHKTVLVKQIIDSTRRVNYVSKIAKKPLRADRANPNSTLFDPIRAALIHKTAGNFDEACWLVFLFIHFGKHRKSEWRFVKEVYGKLGGHPHWTWAEIVVNPQLFRNWLGLNQVKLLRGKNRGFGNHRKYQSMDAYKPTGTGSAVLSYVDWIMAFGGHQQLINHSLQQCQNNPEQAFDWLYNSMKKVVSFGRTAKFDYLTMLKKMELAQIQPGSAYLAGATGPISGARLILQGNMTSNLSLKTMETRLAILAKYLNVDMQVIEDSLCNWQKNRSHYMLFSG